MLYNYFKDIKDTLVYDQCFMNNAFETKDNVGEYDKLDLLIGEAKKTVEMIKPYLKANMRLLEIGGGAGFTYTFLRSQGYDVTSIEPGSDGFGDRYKAGLRLCELLGIDSSGWHKSMIENFNGNNEFDLIFSFYVLEHVESLELAFKAMVRHLKPDGIMVHTCPNYNIPFEPHYNILLFPLKPEWSTLFYPSLRDKGLWQGLNFTTLGRIKKICKNNNLRLTFSKAMTANYLMRVIEDPVFRERKKMFYKLAMVFKKIGLMYLISKLPPAVNTPMEFIAAEMPDQENT